MNAETVTALALTPQNVSGAAGSRGTLPRGDGVRSARHSAYYAAEEVCRNIKADYGAVGDGAADDARKFNAALHDLHTAGGGTLFIPKGMYTIGSTLYVSSHTRIVCERGAVIRRKKGARLGNLLMSGQEQTESAYCGGSGCSHIFIEGGVWDMNGGECARPGNAFSFAHGEHIELSGLTIKDCRDLPAVQLAAVRHVRIITCKFEGFYGSATSTAAAIQLEWNATAERTLRSVSKRSLADLSANEGGPCTDIEVRGCTFAESETVGAGAFPKAIGSGPRSEGDLLWHRQIRFIGNGCSGLADRAVHIDGWRGVEASFNTIAFCGAGITAECNSFGQGEAAGEEASGLSITANTIIHSGKVDHAIAVRGPIEQSLIYGNTIRYMAGVNHPIRIERAEDCAVVGNVISSSMGAAISLYKAAGAEIGQNNICDVMAEQGIMLANCDRSSVTGNILYRAGSQGVAVIGCTDCFAIDNSVIGSGELALTSAYGKQEVNDKRTAYGKQMVQNALHQEANVSAYGYGDSYALYGTAYDSGADCEEDDAAAITGSMDELRDKQLLELF